MTINKYTAISGRALSKVLGLAALDTAEAVRRNYAWQAFAGCWDRLTLDTYMGDNGRYRYRRYGQFRYDALTSSLHLLPHEPYVQPRAINRLNGDIQRHFDPLETALTESPILFNLLREMAAIYSAADGYTSNWRIRLHPYRITGSTGAPGKPTPEGLHRDGVTYIASLMVARRNITGGITRVTTNDRRMLTSVRLTEPLDLLISDDASTMHEVSEVRSLDGHSPSFRDVLVIAFERMDAFG
ncbi:2OG-Fe dioxygenase family protein [Marinobacter fonticola]|uniref:2OG-Fe dioxygenase family protein n=1 Tax=Marinobacter fonticola TaxID=2603215 RepID=UPI00143D4545|nr:2OG-Fe dioxygenase family protein [Marinobacter fonticola]